MSKKKTIGIYGDTFNGKVGQTLQYMQFFNQFGNVRIITNYEDLEKIEETVDILVLPGGADVDSSLYGSTPGVMDGRVNQHYEHLDKILIEKFVKSGKPIIGICRGMQRLNVFFGGTLNQHILGHHQGDDRVVTKQKMQFTNNDNEFLINSLHHQSIDILGSGFEILGYSLRHHNCYSNPLQNISNWRIYNKDGNVETLIEKSIIIEVIKHRELPILGFQYHPEEFNCSYAKQEINELLIDLDIE